MLTVINKAINEVPEAHYGYPQYDDKVIDYYVNWNKKYIQNTNSHK